MKDSSKETQASNSTMKAVQKNGIKAVSAVLRGLEVGLAGLSIVVVIVGICFLIKGLGGFWGDLTAA